MKIYKSLKSGNYVKAIQFKGNNINEFREFCIVSENEHEGYVVVFIDGFKLAIGNSEWLVKYEVGGAAVYNHEVFNEIFAKHDENCVLQFEKNDVFTVLLLHGYPVESVVGRLSVRDFFSQFDKVNTDSAISAFGKTNAHLAYCVYVDGEAFYSKDCVQIK